MAKVSDWKSKLLSRGGRKSTSPADIRHHWRVSTPGQTPEHPWRVATVKLASAAHLQGVPQTVAIWPVSRTYRFLKRAVDVALGVTLFALTLPIMIVAAIAIRLSSRGPVIFSQKRAGLYGRPFTMYKMRTMRQDAQDQQTLYNHLNEISGPTFKIRQDPRVTRVGKFLRKTSIDELPQLANVILGQMSLVGPRPLPLDEVHLDAFAERQRLIVKPGITCLWQISGRNDIPYSEWIELDLYYVQNRSFHLDIAILLKTIPAVLSCKGAY